MFAKYFPMVDAISVGDAVGDVSDSHVEIGPFETEGVCVGIASGVTAHILKDSNGAVRGSATRVVASDGMYVWIRKVRKLPKNGNPTK